MTVSAHVGDSPRESRHILGLFQMGNKKKKNWRILHREAGAIWVLKKKKRKEKIPLVLGLERERERGIHPDSEELTRDRRHLRTLRSRIDGQRARGEQYCSENGRSYHSQSILVELLW